MGEFFAGLILGALAVYVAMRLHYAERERELICAQREVAALTGRLNKAIDETRQVYAGKAALN